MLSNISRNMAVLFAAITLFALASCQSSEAPKESVSKGFKGGETRQTLSPSNFTGDAARSFYYTKHRHSHEFATYWSTCFRVFGFTPNCNNHWHGFFP